MRILSLNVRGLGSLAKKKGLRHLLFVLSPDVVLFQETMTSPYLLFMPFLNFARAGSFVLLVLMVSLEEFSLAGILKSLNAKLSILLLEFC